MQDNVNRVSSKRLHSGPARQKEAIEEARQEVCNALILNPEMSAAQIAETLTNDIQDEAADVLFEVLLRRFYTSLVGVERKKQRRLGERQGSLPGFEHLPVEIPTREGDKLLLVDANYRRVRDYYRSLTRPFIKKLRTDPKVQEARALMLKMRPYASNEERITVRQVLLLEAQ